MGSQSSGCRPHLSEKATKAFKGGEICFGSNRDPSRLAVLPENGLRGRLQLWGLEDAVLGKVGVSQESEPRVRGGCFTW